MNNYKTTLTILISFLIVNSYSENYIHIHDYKSSKTVIPKNYINPITIGKINHSTSANGSVSKFVYNPSAYNNITWFVDTDRCYVVNADGSLGGSLSGDYLYLVFKNIKLNKTAHQIGIQGTYGFNFSTDTFLIPGFTLELHQPTFEVGSSLNIPCYQTSAVINLDDYKNDEGLDEGLTITDEFEWTLPSGWSTSDSQTGTFVAGPSINLVLPTTSAAPTKSISVRAKAGNQYSSSATLTITRNIGDFTISGTSNVNCGQTYQYSTQNFSGVSYSWQLPTGWSGSSTSNTIDATVSGVSGNVSVTATACNSQVSSDNFSIQNVKIIPDNATFNGANILCPTGSTYTITNLFANSFVSWNNRSSNIGLTSSDSTSADLYAINHGAGTITPRVTMTCGYDDMETENIWLGKPDSDDFSVYIEELGGNGVPGNPGGPFEVCEGEQYWICLYPYFLFDDYGITDVEFDFTFDYDLLDEGDDYIEIEINSSPDGEEGEVYVTTNCDYYTLKFMEFEEGNCGYYMMFSPNPTTGETTLSIESNSENLLFDQNIEWELEIYDNVQSLKDKKVKLKGKEHKINTQGWKEGIYNARAKYKDKIITGKLVVKK